MNGDTISSCHLVILSPLLRVRRRNRRVELIILPICAMRCRERLAGCSDLVAFGCVWEHPRGREAQEIGWIIEIQPLIAQMWLLVDWALRARPQLYRGH